MELVTEKIQQLSGNKFYGKLIVEFKEGNPYLVRTEQTEDIGKHMERIRNAESKT